MKTELGLDLFPLFVNRVLSPLAATLIMIFSGGTFAAETPGYPPPGEYRIDSEAVTTMGSGLGALEQTIRTDGATGTVTSTSKSAGGPPASQTVPGSRPVTWCVKPATAVDVPKNSPFACQTHDAQATASSSSFSAACQSIAQESSFRRVDPRTWEHTMTFQVSADRNPAKSAREAMAMASPGMTPAQRAQAQREVTALPTQGEMDKALDEIRHEMEQAIRTGTPEEAEAARQGLQAMQQRSSGAPMQTIRVRERWTLISPTCSAGR